MKIPGFFSEFLKSKFFQIVGTLYIYFFDDKKLSSMIDMCQIEILQIKVFEISGFLAYQQQKSQGLFGKIFIVSNTYKKISSVKVGF